MVKQTFINIHAAGIVCAEFKAFIAEADCFSIHRFTHVSATTVFDSTRVRTDAFAIVGRQFKAINIAFTFEASLCIYTQLVTFIVSICTLINIFAIHLIVGQFKTIWTTAFEASFDVITRMRTNTDVQNAFIYIDAGYRIACQFHSDWTHALEWSQCIFTMVRTLLSITLINIDTRFVWR